MTPFDPVTKLRKKSISCPDFYFEIYARRKRRSRLLTKHPSSLKSLTIMLKEKMMGLWLKKWWLEQLKN